ncbi:hypothetical protein HY990_00515 [Candidatus Micrarchaeota archaeon]|nr:hypothetical protein [Candidatus Micrarchaeota archaeon]
MSRQLVTSTGQIERSLNSQVSEILNHMPPRLSQEASDRATEYLRMAQGYRRDGNFEAARICLDLVALQLEPSPDRQHQLIDQMIRTVVANNTPEARNAVPRRVQ